MGTTVVTVLVMVSWNRGPRWALHTDLKSYSLLVVSWVTNTVNVCGLAVVLLVAGAYCVMMLLYRVVRLVRPENLRTRVSLVSLVDLAVICVHVVNCLLGAVLVVAPLVVVLTVFL